MAQTPQPFRAFPCGSKSIKLPALGLKVQKHFLHWAIWSPRATLYLNPAPLHPKLCTNGSTSDTTVWLEGSRSSCYSFFVICRIFSSTGFRVQGLRVRVRGSMLMLWGLGFRHKGLGIALNRPLTLLPRPGETRSLTFSHA